MRKILLLLCILFTMSCSAQVKKETYIAEKIPNLTLSLVSYTTVLSNVTITRNGKLVYLKVQKQNRTVLLPKGDIIVEYLAMHYPTKTKLLFSIMYGAEGNLKGFIVVSPAKMYLIDIIELTHYKL